ncbi:MAG: hypothetical protein V3U08_01635, partial [Nitrospirales bacterium]
MFVEGRGDDGEETQGEGKTGVAGDNLEKGCPEKAHESQAEENQKESETALASQGRRERPEAGPEAKGDPAQTPCLNTSGGRP